MNMFKKNGGFTLVELIVVIAILAILAGIAVPAYSGYIAKANDAADTTALGAVKTAALAAWAENGVVTEIYVEANGTKITKIAIKGTGTETKGADEKVTDYKVLYTYNEKDNWENDDFKVYMNEGMVELKGSFAKGAVWFAADKQTVVDPTDNTKEVTCEDGWNAVEGVTVPTTPTTPAT